MAEDSAKQQLPIKRRKKKQGTPNKIADNETPSSIDTNNLASPRVRSSRGGSISTESPNIILTPPNPEDVVRETRRLSNATRSPSHTPSQSPRQGPSRSPSHSRQSSISSLHEDHEHDPDPNHLLLPPVDAEPEEVVNKLIHQRRPSKIDVLSAAIRRVFIEKKCKEDAVPAEIVEGLYLGSIGAAKNMQWLKDNGVTHVLCVAGGIGECFPKHFTYKVVDILDSPSVDITAHFEACYEFIEEALQNGGKILVHCFAGMSRSVTVCSAYLMQKEQMKAVQALRYIKERRSVANPNAGFIVQLIKYQKVLGIQKTSPLDLPSGSDLESSANEEEEKADKPRKVFRLKEQSGNDADSLMNHSLNSLPAPTLTHAESTDSLRSLSR